MSRYAYGTLRVPMVPHSEGRAAVAVGARRAQCVTLSLCGSGVRVGPTKVLREKVHYRSLSSIHIDYN